MAWMFAAALSAMELVMAVAVEVVIYVAAAVAAVAVDSSMVVVESPAFCCQLRTSVEVY